LIDKSETISKSIGLLQSRIISSEDEILRKIESLRRELHEIQHDVRWVFDVHRMSEAEILNIIGNGDLEEIRMKVAEGTELLASLKCLSHLFNFPDYSAEPIENAPDLLNALIEIIKPMTQWKQMVLEIRSLPWCQYKMRISRDLENISSAEHHVKNLLKSVGHWTLYQECNSFMQSISATLNLLSSIMSNTLESRHWAKLGGILDREILSDHSLKVSQIWTEHVLDKRYATHVLFGFNSWLTISLYTDLKLKI
jgi:hypothetical protein